MKIVFVSRWFSDKMGYIENSLPAALVQLGHEVHIITTTAQVYATLPFYEDSYMKFLGPPFIDEGTYTVRGVQVHRMPFYKIKSQFIIKGLNKKISTLKPDVIQVFEHGGIDSVRISFFSFFKKFDLYSGNHIVYSVFPQVSHWAQKSIFAKLKVRIQYTLPGYLVSFISRKCFCVTSDAGDIALKYLSVPSAKIAISTLGTDTSLYHPALLEEEKKKKTQLRNSLGIPTDHVVCIYTGRLTAQKNPLITAQALEILHQKGFQVTYLVVGEGEQQTALELFPFVKRIDLQPYPELPLYYQMADIAVWPVEESTSQLDAVACGCNLVLTDKIQAYSLTSDITSEKPQIVSAFFENGRIESLSDALERLMDETLRLSLSAVSLENIKRKNAWEVKARERLAIYLKQ